MTAIEHAESIEDHLADTFEIFASELRLMSDYVAGKPTGSEFADLLKSLSIDPDAEDIVDEWFTRTLSYPEFTTWRSTRGDMMVELNVELDGCVLVAVFDTREEGVARLKGRVGNRESSSVVEDIAALHSLIMGECKDYIF